VPDFEDEDDLQLKKVSGTFSKCGILRGRESARGNPPASWHTDRVWLGLIPDPRSLIPALEAIWVLQTRRNNPSWNSGG
jgi:hypothetical protein